MAATPGTVERRIVHLTGRAAFTIVGMIVGLVVLRGVFVKAHRPLSWAVAATVVAILIDPVVDRLARHIKRVPAVLLTFLAIGTAAVTIAYLVFDGIDQALRRLDKAAPQAANRIQHRDGRVGEIARDFHLTDRVTSFVDTLQHRVTGGGDVLRTTAGTAPTYLVCAILTLFLMTYGPRIAAAALLQDPDEARRERVAAVIGPAVARARTSILCTMAIGASVGVLTAALASWLDLPAPAAIGLTAGVLALLPHVGIVIGSVPLLLLSLGFKSTDTTLVLLACAIVLQVVDSVVVRGWIAHRSVDIGLLVPWVVALIGYQVYGIGGAAYSLAFAIWGLAAFDQLDLRNQERVEAKEAATKKAAAKKAPAGKRSPAKRAAAKKATPRTT